jgi:hypothetical protein
VIVALECCYSTASGNDQLSQDISKGFPGPRHKKHIGGVEVYLHSFFTSTLDGGMWLT